MIPMTIQIKERWGTERSLMGAHKKASKEAWIQAGTMFHLKFRDERFTAAHGKKAGYAKRKGEESGTAGKAFWKSYTGQKLKKWHHKNPLQWSGETRARVRAATITATGTRYLNPTSWTSVDSKGGGCKVAYPGASKLNYRPKGGTINMADEFRRIIPEEAEAIARTYDTAYDAAID
jgi:hypothetical protein